MWYSSLVSSSSTRAASLPAEDSQLTPDSDDITFPTEVSMSRGNIPLNVIDIHVHKVKVKGLQMVREPLTHTSIMKGLPRYNNPEKVQKVQR